MEDFSISARDRFMARVHAREDFITIPRRGTTILGFSNQLNSDVGIIIHVEVDDSSRKKFKLNSRVNKKRKFKIPYVRQDVGKHPDAIGGCIIRDVGDDYKPTLEDTVQFVNLYLGYNITVEDVNERFFDPKNKMLTLRMRKNCLRYCGQIRVNLV